jgi:protein subunit release factor A
MRASSHVPKPLDPKEVKMATFASDHPLQPGNTDFGVEVTHVPTGLSIRYSTTSSQKVNAERAMLELTSRVRRHEAEHSWRNK